MAFTKRRIVIGHDDTGAPVIISDGPAEPSFLGRTTASLWYVGQPPVTVDDGGDEPVDRKDFVPPPGGISWRVFTLKPSGGKAIGPTDDPRFDQKRVGFHATPTFDFIEVISGRIRLELNDHSVGLDAGDCVVQRGTEHAWRNTGDGPFTLSAVMIGVGDG